MLDASRLTRSGKIGTPVRCEKLKTKDGTLAPFCYFDIVSSIQVDDRLIEETAKVLLQDDAYEMAVKEGAQQGDKITVVGAVAYVANGVLCARATSTDQVIITPQATGSEGVTFGLSKKEFIEATKLFTK